MRAMVGSPHQRRVLYSCSPKEQVENLHDPVALIAAVGIVVMETGVDRQAGTTQHKPERYPVPHMRALTVCVIPHPDKGDQRRQGKETDINPIVRFGPRHAPAHCVTCRNSTGTPSGSSV